MQHPTSEEAMSRGKTKVQKRKAELISADSRMLKLKGKKASFGTFQMPSSLGSELQE